MRDSSRLAFSTGSSAICVEREAESATYLHEEIAIEYQHMELSIALIDLSFLLPV